MLNRDDNIRPLDPPESQPPGNSPEEDWYTGYFIDEDDGPNEEPTPQPTASLSDRFAALSPRRQMGYGCFAIIMLSALLVYCVGGATVFVRPMLAERAAVSPTTIVRPTLAPTPTQDVKPTFIQLPPGNLVATPTQAPIPTREPATVTPTTAMVNGMTVTPSPSPTGKVSPTGKPSVAPTNKP